MSLLVVLPFCKADQSRALALLDWIGELGGCHENDCLLVVDIDTPAATVHRVAHREFRNVSVIHTPFKLKNEKHPIGPNWMFETALKWLSRDKCVGAFLWLEPDAVPLRRGWLKEIGDEYTKSGMRILASVVSLNDPKYPKRIPSGVAVYPADAWSIYGKIQTNRGVAWDVQFADKVMPICQPSATIVSRLNHENAPMFVGRKEPHHGKNTLTLADIPATAALFHPNKDGTLIEQLKIKMRGRRSLFYHSGDLGDIIYSLITVRELGGGEFYLGPDNRTNMAVREKMTAGRAAQITPLIESQSYVHKAAFAEDMPDGVRYDLNQMRLLLREKRLDLQAGYNLARVYLEAFGLAHQNDQRAWLEVKPNKVAEVIVNRSTRYHNRAFHWGRIVKEYRGDIAFVGLPDEHKAFCAQYGPVPRIPTNDLLEAAQVIAGAKLFVGNQSCCYSIAEGLKKPAVLETCPGVSNTKFLRPDVIHDCTADTILPNIGQSQPVKLKPRQTLTIAGPVDNFTGIAREVCNLAGAAVAGKLPVALQPLLTIHRNGLPKAVEALLQKAVPRDGPRLLVCPFTWIPNNLRFGDTLMTMWESTRLDPEIVAQINARAARVIVPSQWCATVFSANGVVAPIHVIPLSVDTKVYTRATNVHLGTTIFGAAGRLAHGGKRKGIEDVIAAFRMAFPDVSEKVLLYLKLFKDCYIPKSDDPRVIVEDRTLSDSEMVSWYGAIDCFICASKAEGWGLHAHEAIALGVPVIAPKYSGLADIPISCSLDYKIVPASEGYLGHWCQPSVENLAELMRAIADRKLHLDVGDVSDWTPTNNLERILEVMR